MDLESQTIRKREEFREASGQALELSDDQLEEEAQRLAEAEASGLPYTPEYYGNPVRTRIGGHSARYPLSRIGGVVLHLINDDRPHARPTVGSVESVGDQRHEIARTIRPATERLAR